jgi:hypothetical protein
MSHLRPELIDSSQMVRSQPHLDQVLGTLQPGETVEFVLDVTEPIDSNPLFLRYTWLDTADHQGRQYISRVTVPEW